MFFNRKEAGQQLGLRLMSCKKEQPVVVALPRGGVPVGFEVARLIEAPLDICAVRKLGAPGQPELAIGAVNEGKEPHVHLDPHTVRELDVSKAHIDREVAAQVEKIRRMERLYRSGRPGINVRGRVVILVDDGLATGATARAALKRLRLDNPARLILAVPVAPRSTLDSLRPQVDDLVCLRAPEDFWAVGNYYRDFSPVSDEEVVDLLNRASRHQAAA